MYNGFVYTSLFSVKKNKVVSDCHVCYTKITKYRKDDILWQEQEK